MLPFKETNGCHLAIRFPSEGMDKGLKATHLSSLYFKEFSQLHLSQKEKTKEKEED